MKGRGLCRLFLILLALTGFNSPSGFTADAPISYALLADPALDFNESAAFQALTVTLSQQQDMVQVERAEIEKILKEQSLQLTMSAEGGEARRKLGSLIKARLLVIFHAGERMAGGKSKRYVDLAICESEHGLRLVQDQIPWDEANPKELIDSSTADLALGCQRLAEPIKMILAIPPFVSDDLTHRYDAMQQAYAKLLEEWLKPRRGVRLVELAEARAIAAEIGLTDGGGSVRRELLPFTLNGRYRNTGNTTTRTVTLLLELKQGEKTLAQKPSGVLSAEDVARFLRQSAQSLLDERTGKGGTPYAEEKEIAEMADRAWKYAETGAWEQALTMIEAALLLKPTDVKLLQRAFSFSAEAIKQANTKDASSMTKALDIHFQALDHFAAYLRLQDFDKDRWGRNVSPEGARLGLDDSIAGFWSGEGKYYSNVSWEILQSPEYKQRIDELFRAKREIMLSNLEFMADHPEARHIHSIFFPDYQHDVALPTGMRRSTSKSIKDPSEAEVRDLLRAARAVWKINPTLVYLKVFTRTRIENLKMQEAYLTELGKLPGRECGYMVQMERIMRGKELQSKLDSLKKLLEGVKAAGLAGESNKQLQFDIEQNISLVESQSRNEALNARNRQAEAMRLPAAVTPTPQASPAMNDYEFEPIPGITDSMLGWIEAGQGVDLLWDRGNLYSMRQPGELFLIATTIPVNAQQPLEDTPGIVVVRNNIINRQADKPWAPIPLLENMQEGFRDVVYDGRWAWAPMPDKLLVIDPTNNTFDLLDQKQGIPGGKMQVAPLGPGRVCVVGGFDRAWCATVDYAGPGKAKVDVFHEARLAVGEWNSPLRAFTPRFAATLRGADGQPRVLVGRETKDQAKYLALLLDPERRRVEVVDQAISGRLQSDMITDHEGKLYWIASIHNPMDEPNEDPAMRLSKPMILFSFGARLFKPRIEVERLFDQAQMTMHYPLAGFLKGSCFIFRDDCWLLDQKTKKLIHLKGKMEEMRKAENFWNQCRLGRSNHYGLVILEQNEYKKSNVCKAFRPQPSLVKEQAWNESNGRLTRKPPNRSSSWKWRLAGLILSALGGYILILKRVRIILNRNKKP